MFIPLLISANDGAYFASGNQLIPISDADVSVIKEVLTITRKVDNGIEYVYVTVNYTFFNANKEKVILVGFEAPSPSGDVNGFPKNGAHPYISNFNVNVNGALLAYETAIVNAENYYINDKIDAKTEREVIDDDFNSNNPDFYYVYHFNAKFASGINKVTHTYRFNMSGSLMEDYNFDYILTAANRWSNHQIDDFTLNIDMGLHEGFIIKNSFFDTKDNWEVDSGRIINSNNNYTKFITYNGGVTFKKKNFKPNGELSLSSIKGPMKDHYISFDHTIHNLPHAINVQKQTCTNAENENSFKILRNLPFAIRGYVFKTNIIQAYYLSQYWYEPNPLYKVNLEALSEEEKEWLAKVNSKN